MKPVVFTAAVDTAVPARVAFDRVVPRDDSDLFTGYLVLPAVTSISGQTGPWSTPGSQRIVHLSDGGTFREHLEHHHPPATPASSTPDAAAPGDAATGSSAAVRASRDFGGALGEDVGRFDYRVTDFTGILSHIVGEAAARWRYEPRATGSRIRWTYEYHPLPGRRFLVHRVIGPIWLRYMRRSLARCAEVAEGR
jgi:hypothetical protein